SQYGLNAEDFYTQNGSSATTIAGGGGGASSAAVCSTSYNSSGTCAGTLSGYPKPAWQTGTGVPADKVRDIPDVSLFSADGWNYSYYPICAGDGDCQTPSGSNLVQITGVGGTSAAAPSFAGIMALVNQEYGRQGQAGFVLYPLATQFPAAFHDVTVGTNAEPCAYSATAADNSPNCNSVPNPITVTDPNLGAATEGELAGYSATAGYDPATGLGSVDASVLISDWGSVKFTSTNVTLTPSETSFAHGTAISINGSVAPTSGSGTATGTVALMTDSTEPVQQGQTNFPLTNGSFAASGVNYLPGGTYNIWGQYSGDATNAAAPSQKTQITVNPEASGIYFTVSDVGTGSGGGPAISSGTTNIPYGTQLILSAQVAPSSQLTAYENCQTGASSTCPIFTEPTGTVAFADNTAAINTAVINAEGDAEYNAPWTIGSHSVTAKYSGDSSYNASTAPAFTFSIAQDIPVISPYTTIATQSNALVSNQQNVFTIQVLNSANAANESAYGAYSNPAAAPTGTVTISGFPSGVATSATLSPGIDGSTLSPAGIATITLPANSANTSYSITIKYLGDTNYAPTTFTGTIAVQNVGGVATTTTATITGSISPISTVTISGTVTGKSGDAAPSNTGGGILIYSAGYILQEISVIPGTGDTSTFSTTLSSRSLLQGTNPITVQYLGDNTYAPSTVTLTTPISNPLSDFSMVPNTTIVPVTVGTPATDTIQLASVNGFVGTVNYTCTAASGITCTLSPTSNTFASGGTATMTLTLDASSSAANGPNNVLITGTGPSGLFVHTLAINADVSGSSSLPSVGFALNVSPTAISLAPESSTTAPGLSVMPSGGFTGPVALTATVTPSGATSPTVTINPAALQVTGASAISAGLSITTTSSTTVGTYTVDFTGTYSNGGVNITAGTNTPLTIIVTNITPASFALSNSANITIASPGSSGTSTLTVTPAGGFTGAVAFTCAVTTSPAGAVNAPTCSAPSATVSSGNATATLTVATTPATTSALRHPLDKFFVAGGGMVFAGLLFFGIPSRRRSWRSILAILLFAGIVGLGIGCGGS
ncbi:MAG: Ig-like domain repeat protein, partial [Silvibacterium sp.]